MRHNRYWWLAAILLGAMFVQTVNPIFAARRLAADKLDGLGLFTIAIALALLYMIGASG